MTFRSLRSLYRQSLSFCIILFTSVSLTLTCIGVERTDTAYYKNKQRDAAGGLDLEDKHAAVAEGVGEDVYEDLLDRIGQGPLDLLIYDAGESNMIALINAVITCGGTADKLVDLISVTGASPTKINAETVLGMLNETDAHLRSEPSLPFGNDTIAKLANLICKVDIMDDLVYIVNNMDDYAGATNFETEAIKRLSILTALIDHNADNMPTIINVIANTPEGKFKLLRMLEEVENLRKVTTLINGTDVLDNLLSIVNLIEHDGPFPTGVDSMITTLNLLGQVHDLYYFINELTTISDDINNDDGFETGDLTRITWATSGTTKWTVNNGDAYSGSYSAVTSPALGDHGNTALELAVNLNATGNITFRYKTDTEAGKDYFKFYLDDTLKLISSGGGGWQSASIPVATTGIHRLRWEYVKDEAGSTGADIVRIDDVNLPGDAGTSYTGSEKVAIMLNQLDITAQTTVAEIMNDLDSDSFGYTGLDNLVTIINAVEYPGAFTDEPRLVTVVNDINSVPTMTALLKGVDDTGVTALIELVDHAPDILQISDIVNEMDDAGLGSKMTGMLNGIDIVGAQTLAKVTAAVPSLDLVTLIDEADTVVHMSEILNSTYLHGSVQPTTLEASAGISGGDKLSAVINGVVSPSNGLNMSDHLVRLINELSSSPLGPSSVGKLIGTLDPLATNSSGIDRLLELMEERAVSSTPLYSDNTSTATNDEYGRIITLMNSLGSDGPENLGRMINEISCNDLSNQSNCRVYNLADLVLDTTRIVYLSRFMSEMSNVDLVIDLLSDPATDFVRIQTLLNSTGDATYDVGTPANIYSDPMEFPSVDEDFLGRMITTINYVSGDLGISNIISLVNGVNYTDGVTDNYSILIEMVKSTNRIIYMTRLISDATNLNLVIQLMNELDPSDSDQVDRLRTMVNTFGDDSYGSGQGIGSAPSPLYSDPLAVETNDSLGRMIVFINDLLAQAGGGGNEAIAINNAVTMIKDSYDLTFVMDFLRQIERIRYVTGLVANIANIGLMMTIINGETGDGSDGAELPKLLTLMDNYGGSTRLGDNLTGKSVGEMTMLADVIDELGAGPLNDQAKVVALMNGVIYCGVRPTSDLTIEGAGVPGDFYNCDDDVSYDYDSNQGSIDHDPRHRLSYMMLSINSANTMAILVGDVSEPAKTVRMMNGARRINTLTKVVNWLPPEVTRDFINTVNLDVVYSSLVYLANNLSPDEHEAAQAMGALLHYGTGISGSSNTRSDNSTCKYYTAMGPKRLASLLNIEPGRYLEGIMTMFGWRSAIPAMMCSFGTPNAPTPQTLNGTYGSADFARTEQVYANADGTGAQLYNYRILNNDTCTTYCNGACWFPWDQNYGWMKEMSGAVILVTVEDETDTITWEGFNVGPVQMIPPGLAGVWDVLKGGGLVGWLMQQDAGYMSMPPTDTSQHGNPECTDSSYTDEWSCIKHGKNVGGSNGNISYHRWGNYCSIPGYSDPGPCEANGGRWLPDKNYSACFVNPESDSAVGQ